MSYERALITKQSEEVTLKFFYSVENIRRIRNMPLIEMRPITVLVGRNSAGKSTFLRSMPLIRQSIETRASAPLLWYGSYVDFGDATTALSSDDDTPGRFSFRFEDFRVNFRNVGRRLVMNGGTLHSSQHHKNINASLVVTVAEAKGKTVRDKLEIGLDYDETLTIFDFGRNSNNFIKISVNGKTVETKIKVPKAWEDSALFGLPAIDTEGLQKNRALGGFIVRRNRSGAVVGTHILSGLYSEAHQLLTQSLTKNHSATRIASALNRLLFVDRYDASNVEHIVQHSNLTKGIKEYLTNMVGKMNSGNWDPLMLKVAAMRAVFAQEAMQEYLEEYAFNLRYLGPARAANERYYRQQELAISEISPDGSNLPMYLASLSAQALSDFSEWVNGIFGYRVALETSSGHVSIHLKTGKKSVNVTDTGYGVSQILPVLGMMWLEKNKTFERTYSPYRQAFNGFKTTLFIEQPELHLHPAHQAKLADAFSAAIKVEIENNNQENLSPYSRRQSKAAIGFVVETHSEALINRLGELIRSGHAKASDIQIIIFSSDGDMTSPPKIQVAEYTEAGTLTNWPYGFFDYD